LVHGERVVDGQLAALRRTSRRGATETVIDGMSTYRASRSAVPPQLVLGFGNLTEHAIARGIATIADVLTDQRHDSG
jgi:hypothetical protein